MRQAPLPYSLKPSPRTLMRLFPAARGIVARWCDEQYLSSLAMIKMRRTPFALLFAAAFAPAAAQAQHSQVSAVAVDPNDASIVWVCNRDNNSVSRIDTDTQGVTEIAVGVNPRSIAFSDDGTQILVANQRGNIPVDENIVLGFTGMEFGTVSVINNATQLVTSTITDVGVEPYGIAYAPNGEYFAVTGFRSGTVKFYNATSLSLIMTHQYLHNLSQLPGTSTLADADEDRDGIADFGEPRGFVIRDDSTRMYVTHNRSSWVSALDITLNGSGLPTAVSEAAKIQTSDYAVDPFFNPIPIKTVESQGFPRFLEDIALSPDGSRALVPHVLHNVNHDVNHDFMGEIDGDFANRVYPALTILDTATDTYGQPGDNSGRLHHDWSDEHTPAEFATYAEHQGITPAGDRISVGSQGDPLLGVPFLFKVSGLQPGDTAMLWIGTNPLNVMAPMGGRILVNPRRMLPVSMFGNVGALVPNNPVYVDLSIYAQVVAIVGGVTVRSHGLRARLENTAMPINKMGHRAGHPGRVLYGNNGNHAVMLNRGSEDVFLYDITGGDMQLRAVHPPRLGFTERAALDTSTPMGDLPLGMVLVDDPSTANNDALLYVINETTHTLSTLRIDYTTNAVIKEADQIDTLTGPDAFTLSERIGQELFEDSSRPQTAGNFNNSCGSCHFEGGEDGNVWQRPAGPRSTMPMYGGTKGTGLILWKGVRLNSGETGPMFAGENGGSDVFSDDEQQGLVDYHETLAIPLNPNLDASGNLTAQAEFGRDLFFGSNDTGLNPMLRSARCVGCHPDADTNPLGFPGPRFFTADFVNPLLSGGEMLGPMFDPDCFSLRQNIVAENIRDVNTGCNIDKDGIPGPDPDRNNDGFIDLETYAIMNVDTNDDFRRDDPNSYQCPCDPMTEPNCDAGTNTLVLERDSNLFSIPTKLGVYSTGPYFHDQAALTLRSVVDPEAQALDAKYGSAAFPLGTPFPGLNKLFNGEHDVRGHNTPMLPGISKVQLGLQSIDPDADTEAILAFIQSL
jgi:YVTN family beta-propeller protein